MLFVLDAEGIVIGNSRVVPGVQDDLSGCSLSDLVDIDIIPILNYVRENGRCRERLANSDGDPVFVDAVSDGDRIYLYLYFDPTHEIESSLLLGERFFDLAPIGIGLFDIEGRIQRLNRQAEKLFVTQSIPSEFRLFEDRFLPERTKALLRDGKSDEGDQLFSYNRDVKVWAHFYISPLKTTDHKICGYMAITWDITAQKKAETELIKSEKKYRKYMENSPDAIVVIDSDGMLLHTNSVASRMTGYDRDEMSGMTIFDIVPQNQKQEASDYLNQVMIEGNENAIETEVLTRAGAILPVEVKATAIYENNALDSLLITARDISEIRESMKQAAFLNDNATRLLTVNTVEQANKLLMQSLKDVLPGCILLLNRYFSDTQEI